MKEQETVEISFLKDADNTIKTEILTFRKYLSESSNFFDNETEAGSESKRNEESYKKFLYNSQLLTYYAFFEAWLKELCDCHHRLGFNRMTVKDLAGRNYIEKSKLYFEKVADFHLGDLREEWHRIQTLQQIRNLIAHNNSSIIKNSDNPINKQPQYQLICNEKSIKLDMSTGDFFINENRFLLDVLDLIQLYLSKIIRMIDKPRVVVKSSELPYDMGNWGIEKVLTLIKSTINGVEQFENCKTRTDEYRFSDTIENGIGNYKSMNWNLTKLLSLFSGAKWDVGDCEIINKNGKKGLAKLKEKYNVRDIFEDNLDEINIDTSFEEEPPF
ncbi:MAG: hypothetical protein JNN12_16140 [Bacteroidetes Order II. Incertae sedis bacterium]|nr:hypothetical protein [Bacteroidetes Order II. bacterium]